MIMREKERAREVECIVRPVVRPTLTLKRNSILKYDSMYTINEKKNQIYSIVIVAFGDIYSLCCCCCFIKHPLTHWLHTHVRVGDKYQLFIVTRQLNLKIQKKTIKTKTVLTKLNTVIPYTNKPCVRAFVYSCEN